MVHVICYLVNVDRICGVHGCTIHGCGLGNMHMEIHEILLVHKWIVSREWVIYNIVGCNKYFRLIVHDHGETLGLAKYTHLD